MIQNGADQWSLRNCLETRQAYETHTVFAYVMSKNAELYRAILEVFVLH
jgi:hypothetical protein